MEWDFRSSVYKSHTTEVYRIEMRYLSRFKPWIHRTEIWFQGHDYKIKMRHHMKERIHGYLHTPSQHQEYIELYPCEADEMIKIMDGIDHFKIVEIGLNRKYHICKLGIVTRLESTQRFLFMAIGADQGLKTFYVTPTFKYRRHYQKKYSSIRMLQHPRQIPHFARLYL